MAHPTSRPYGVTLREALEEFQQDLELFDSNLYAAMEANSATPDTTSLTTTAKKSSTTDAANNSISGKSKDMKSDVEIAREMVQKFEEKMKTLEERSEKVYNRTLAIIKTADDANKELLDSINTGDLKLQEAITVINWSYNHKPQRYLHPKVLKMSQVVFLNIRYLHETDNNHENSVLALNNSDLEEKVMRSIGAPSVVSRYTQFVTWTQTQFRGKKTEREITGSTAKTFITDLTDYSKTQVSLKKDIGEVDRAIRTMSASVRKVFNDTGVNETDKQSLMKKVDKVCKLVIMYINMVYIIYRLHTEYVLNRRAILRRLYQK